MRSGYALDASTSPRALALIHVRAGELGADASATESHLDPLTAAPERNRFLQTVVPFLRKLRASPP